MASDGTLKDVLRRRTAADERAERARLGFVRRPMVQWLSPTLLAQTRVEIAVSGAFGKFADKRELQAEAQPDFDYSSRRELWIDFLSDTADGWLPTQTMAWLLAQNELPGPEGEALRRGHLLLFGGDQVYPTASAEAYEDRFVGPFRAALPWVDDATAPDLFALPGNHDWYDGLTSFLRLFAQPGWIGGWRKQQRRSYFAIELPHRWWIWAIDIQLDTYIDHRQLDYFDDVARRRLRPGDHVVLVTAKPSWLKAEPGHLEPLSWRNLAYFEQKMIRDRGARLMLTVTGDLHHYSRYAPVEGAGRAGGDEPVRLTAGGGGAYLSPTHTLPRKLSLRSWQDPFTRPDPGAVTEYECERAYPRPADSKRRRFGVLKLALTTPGFARMMAVVYTAFAVTLLGALNTAETGLVAAATADGFDRFLADAASGPSIAVAAALVVVLGLYADLPWKLAKALVGLGHGLVHLGIVAVAVWLVAHVFSTGAPGVLLWLAALPVAAFAGYLVGTFIFASFLLGLHVLLGPKAPNHTNEVFAAQGIMDAKCFLRMRLDPSGWLTVHALGVDRICREWDLVEDEHGGPRLVPRGESPRAVPIDEPLMCEGPARG